jgi:cytochrome b6-f complex iron-sulfur subunit
MTQISGSPDVPDIGRRQFMNLLTFGAVTGTALGALYPVIKYFIPPSSGAAGGGVIAKDALGKDVSVSEFLDTHNPGERTLAQGLKGDPTYIVVEADKTIAGYGINAVCTHW